MSENNQKKSKESNRRGGSRKGAGRKPGAANTKTREIADKAAREGVTPLEVMLKTMSALVAQAEKVKGESTEPGEKPGVAYLDLMIEAAGVAKDAAPYMHPRLQAVEVSGPNGGPMESVSMSKDEFQQVAAQVAANV